MMAYIRKIMRSVSRGRDKNNVYHYVYVAYYNVAKCIRDGKKVKQVHLASLGRNTTVQGRINEIEANQLNPTDIKLLRYGNAEITKLREIQEETGLP
jgi:hypothetical protein